MGLGRPFFVVLVWCLASAGPVAAQPAVSSGAAQPAVSSDAADLARDALAKYREGQYAEAGELFVRAHELSGRPSPLWNAAKAFALAGQVPRARELFRRYQALPTTTADEKAEAEAEVARLGAVTTATISAVSPLHPTTAPPPPALTTSTPAPAPSTRWGVVIGFSGATLAAVAAVPLLVDARDRESGLEASLAETRESLIVGVDYSTAVAERDTIVRERAIGGALLGAAAVAASVTLWAWLSSSD